MSLSNTTYDSRRSLKQKNFNRVKLDASLKDIRCLFGMEDNDSDYNNELPLDDRYLRPTTPLPNAESLSLLSEEILCCDLSSNSEMGPSPLPKQTQNDVHVIDSLELIRNKLGCSPVNDMRYLFKDKYSVTDPDSPVSLRDIILKQNADCALCDSSFMMLGNLWSATPLRSGSMKLESPTADVKYLFETNSAISSVIESDSPIADVRKLYADDSSQPPTEQYSQERSLPWFDCFPRSTTPGTDSLVYENSATYTRTPALTDIISRNRESSPSLRMSAALRKINPPMLSHSLNFDRLCVENAWEYIQGAAKPTNWCILPFEKSNFLPMKCGSTFKDFRNHFHKQNLAFGVLRIHVTPIGSMMPVRLTRYILITWIGNDVPIIDKVRLSMANLVVTDVIRPTLLHLQLDSRSELSRDFMKQCLRRVGFSLSRFWNIDGDCAAKMDATRNVPDTSDSEKLPPRCPSTSSVLCPCQLPDARDDTLAAPTKISPVKVDSAQQTSPGLMRNILSSIFAHVSSSNVGPVSRKKKAYSVAALDRNTKSNMDHETTVAPISKPMGKFNTLKEVQRRNRSNRTTKKVKRRGNTEATAKTEAVKKLRKKRIKSVNHENNKTLHDKEPRSSSNEALQASTNEIDLKKTNHNKTIWMRIFPPHQETTGKKPKN